MIDYETKTEQTKEMGDDRVIEYENKNLSKMRMNRQSIEFEGSPKPENGSP